MYRDSDSVVTEKDSSIMVWIRVFPVVMRLARSLYSISLIFGKWLTRRRWSMLGYVAIIVVVLFVAFLIIRGAKPQPYAVGGLYSVLVGPGEYGVVKLLAHDPRGVHLAVYGEKFGKRPRSVDPKVLTVSGDHLPMIRKGFACMMPLLIDRIEVGEDELKGYRKWVSRGGSYNNK